MHRLKLSRKLILGLCEDQRVDVLLCLVDDDDRAVDGTVRVVAPLEFFIVLSIQLITPTLLWPSTLLYCERS